MSRLSILLKGLIRENPVLVSVLGICPMLAVSTQVSSALGMGAATTFVLIGSNILISLFRNIIPDKVRIPCYIVFIAGFVTVVKMIIEAYAYPLYMALGIFLPLITVNCIIFARAEIFAKKNSVLDSALDGAGMGAGFTLALIAMASVREIIGSGKWFGIELPLLIDFNVPILTLAPGGFAAFGILIAVVNKVSKGKAIKKKEFGCAGCLSAEACSKISQKGGAA
ncbi:MAG: electron transport complex subunit E [Treponema sp.]|jgi:electron transport complex protein RnfE|nr:electron transport complex subunit E [Treponema sp.]